MSKLGAKIVISYVIIVLIATAVFMAMIKSSINSVTVYEKKTSLLKVSKSISQNISGIISETNIRVNEIENIEVGIQDSNNYYIEADGSIVTIPKEVFYDNTGEYNIYLVDNLGKLLYIFHNDRHKVQDVFTGSRYFSDKQDIYVNGSLFGSVVVSTQVNDWENINNIIYGSIYSGFLITMLISMIIALLFEINIVGPISKLRLNISNISIDKEMKWHDIKTSDELEEINTELQTITKKLVEYNRTQKEFFQNTSHELKTPLMSIQGYAEAIKDGVLDKDEVKKSLDIIIEESHKLSDMITSVIYLSSIEKHTFDKESKLELVNIYDEIEILKENLAFIESKRHLYIKNKVPNTLCVEADPEKVSRVLSNLFSNAVRYAKNVVEFSFFEDEDTVHLLVSDDGKGFDENESNRVFDRFYKGDDGESGLGLSIVSTIIKSSNGSIKAYNSQKGGAVVEITFYKNDSIYY